MNDKATRMASHCLLPVYVIRDSRLHLVIHKGVFKHDKGLSMKYRGVIDLGALFCRFHWSSQRGNRGILSEDRIRLRMPLKDTAQREELSHHFLSIL